ncbi:WxL protein peptidoglycan domain-containing protein [Microbacterium ulmi]|uniref:DUF916 domain-containing protein n=1 Tax=Microbacterium ulmi TaxID=179095 RepID=A0A7Y2M025_9MICO|nr:DUF916 domain-containing protein [Microbacterium ulmi]NII68924.1 hypothetical protein [Microbacterium ulmi]NNH03907.1 DUF916 domain-containing protein [Microbacterium ulmi]
MHTLVTTSPRSVLRAALLALVAIGLAAAPVGAAHAADDDAAWSVRTAAGAFGDDRTSFGYTLDPGAEVDDALVVANHGTEPLELAVYAADGFTTESGQFDLVSADEKSIGIGAWLHSDAETITVGPGETADVPFTLAVPENATPGDYAGGIVTSLAEHDSAASISVDRRLGIRIALRVGGDLAPSLAVEDAHLSWDGGLDPFAGGDATVSYTIRNTGNAVLSARQAATVAGPFGLFATQAPAVDAPPQLLPGESWTVSFPVRDVPAALWLTATATVTPIVVDASGSTTALAPVTATAVGAAVPWALLVLVVVLALLVVVALRVRSRRRARRQALEDARVQEAVERALAETQEQEHLASR